MQYPWIPNVVPFGYLYLVSIYQRGSTLWVSQSFNILNINNLYQAHLYYNDTILDRHLRSRLSMPSPKTATQSALGYEPKERQTQI